MKRLQYSLRTLFLAVLLLASAGLLARHWAAWRVGFVFPDYVINHSDKWIVTQGDVRRFRFWNYDGQCVGEAVIQDSNFRGSTKNGTLALFQKGQTHELDVYSLDTKTWRKVLLPPQTYIRVISLPNAWVLAMDAANAVHALNIESGNHFVLGQDEKLISRRDLLLRSSSSGVEVRSVLTGETNQVHLPPGKIIGWSNDLFAWHTSGENTVFIVNATSGKILCGIKSSAHEKLKAYFDSSGTHVLVWGQPASISPIQVWMLPEGILIDELQLPKAMMLEMDFSGPRYIERTKTFVVKSGSSRVDFYEGSSTPLRTYFGVEYDYDIPELAFEEESGRLIHTGNSEELANFRGFRRFKILSRDSICAQRDGKMYLFKRVRPEAWWGIAWLPEFWLVIAVSGLWVWNFRLLKHMRIMIVLVTIAGLLVCGAWLYRSEKVLFTDAPTGITVVHREKLFGNGEAWLRKGNYEALICTFRPAQYGDKLIFTPDIGRTFIHIDLTDSQNRRISAYRINQADSEKPHVQSTDESMPYIIP